MDVILMIDIIFDTVIDVVKILPFLWAAFFVLELMEHKLGKKTKFVTISSGRFGPLVGGVLGAFLWLLVMRCYLL